MLCCVVCRYTRLGDFGDVAQECAGSVRTLFKPKPLHVQDVYTGLRKIAALTGAKSQESKRNIVKVRSHLAISLTHLYSSIHSLM